MKRTDKAIFRMVSKFSGRNVSELRGSSPEFEFRRPSPLCGGEGRTMCRRLTDETRRSGGVVETARGQGQAKQLEKPSSFRPRNRRKQGTSYNRQPPGKGWKTRRWRRGSQ